MIQLHLYVILQIRLFQNRVATLFFFCFLFFFSYWLVAVATVLFTPPHPIASILNPLLSQPIFSVIYSSSSPPTLLSSPILVSFFFCRQHSGEAMGISSIHHRDSHTKTSTAKNNCRTHNACGSIGESRPLIWFRRVSLLYRLDQFPALLLLLVLEFSLHARVRVLLLAGGHAYQLSSSYLSRSASYWHGKCR